MNIHILEYYVQANAYKYIAIIRARDTHTLPMHIQSYRVQNDLWKNDDNLILIDENK